MPGMVLAVVRGATLHDPTPKPLLLRIAIAVLVVVALLSLALKARREEVKRKHGRKHDTHCQERGSRKSKCKTSA